MATATKTDDCLQDLNDAQRGAVEHGWGPLLVVAGAGTGKTRAIVHRVAHLIDTGVDPRRILLLTFTRRAAAEMLRRVDQLVGPRSRRSAAPRLSGQVWGGTFHAVATRLLRRHGAAVALDAGFTILDRGDAEDLLDVIRTELRLTATGRRFPRKGTCLAIYSACVNSGRALEDVLQTDFPWCQEWADQLKPLFRAYVDRKQQAVVLDYDDLLLFWRGLLADSAAGEAVRERFDCVLVDEYQDTNRVQADILQGLCPDGRGLTVVGDDAQSIYSFRAATVRNILDFPRDFPGTTVVKLEQNYRSTPSILEVSNRVMAESRERYAKNLWTTRRAGQLPELVSCQDEDEQAEFIIGRLLEHREAGMRLRDQAVLFRTSHHSMLLEAELSRRNIPFVKYGGLKFMETAHVKDLLAFLRLAENPRDVVAGSRVLMLLPGIGPQRARQRLDELLAAGGDFGGWQDSEPPAACRELWGELVALLRRLARSGRDVPGQIQAVLRFYQPLLEDKYDHPQPRLRELEQLQQVAERFRDRQTLLADLALDPPSSSADFAGDPHLDEDYLILSTIHSAKGLEWRVVFTIHAADGNIPSDMATGTAAQIEEERRLFYVALTRARDWLYVCWPQRYYHVPRGPRADRYGCSQLTRFVSEAVLQSMQRTTAAAADDPAATPTGAADVRAALKALWTSGDAEPGSGGEGETQ